MLPALILTLRVLWPRELLPKEEEPRPAFEADAASLATSSSVTPSSSCRILDFSNSQFANIRCWNCSLKALTVYQSAYICGTHKL